MSTTTSRFLRVLAPVVALATALLLQACAAPARPTQSTAPSLSGTATVDGLLPPAEGVVSYPLTLKTAWGDVTIPKRPERVVAGDLWDFSLVAALNVTPVGVASRDEVLEDYVPWAKDYVKADKIEHTWETGDVALPLEPIAKAKPGLIVATANGLKAPSNLKQLNTIAPTLGAPDNGESFSNWQDRLNLIAQALDLTRLAKQRIDEYGASFATMKQEHPEFGGKTVAFLGYWGNQYGAGYMNSPKSGYETFLEAMGFAHNPNADEFDVDADLSAELLGKVRGDVLIAFDLAGTRKEFDDWVNTPLFQRIEAVRAGQVLLVENSDRKTLRKDGKDITVIGHLGVASNDPIGTPRFARVMAELLAETIKG